MNRITPYHERLKMLHKQTVETPLFNPVFQLSLDMSRDIEGGALSMAEVEGIVEALEAESLRSRANRLHNLVAPTSATDNQARFRKIVEASTAEGNFAAFCATWSKPLLHAVFTGHPTFLLSAAQSDAVATMAVGAALPGAPTAERDAMTLSSEHDQVIAAMRRAAWARDQLSAIILDVARAQWPAHWQAVKPMPFRLASWVGYDMDGRTDISWSTSISYRLAEKAERLDGYRTQLRSIIPDHAFISILGDAAELSRDMAARFAQDVSEPTDLSSAANAIAADHPAKLLSLAALIAQLEEEAKAAEPEEATALLVLAAAMRADGLGMGWIHFRVNAAQLHNAIRRRIDPDNSLDLASRMALKRMRKLLAEVKPLRSNFAALAIETTTAIRQFLAMAQILNHVDADAPIRMLIAECEDPQTVLAALYFAKLFGIENKVDVSPLFETESALEHGGRFLEALIGEESYRDYVRLRGRLCIQTGFSDAGRFVGQLPASLAIERLQGRLARSMAAAELTGVSALIFNTHGESMGRGAHPASIEDRLLYPLSPWTRGQFGSWSIALEPEVSFQGGDGYLFFRSDELALAALTRIAEVEAKPTADLSDPFYSRTDLSLDFYRSIRRVQRDYLASRTYARAITAFGLGMLNETGSRKSRRQSDLAADREMNLRQIRAIPHNAVLQQLGYPVNVIAGVGTAAGEDVEGIADLINTSSRGRALMRMLKASNALASIKSVAAYGELFNSAYWASRPYRGTETHLEDSCLALAEHLAKDDRTGVFRRLASRLRVDAMKLHRLLAKLTDETPETGREDTRRSLGVLHALRLALMQHMFLKAVQIPAFSRSNDISRDDVLEMIFTLRIDEAVAQLRRAYPVIVPTISDYAVNQPTDYPEDGAQTYASIQVSYIDPIAQAQALSLRISTAIANHFGAHG